MANQETVTLFVGTDPESEEAVKALRNTGITLRIFDKAIGQFDFDTPLLISPWGVFEGLNSIIWFTQVASQHEMRHLDVATGD